MELDKTTFFDLSVFNAEDEFSVFGKLDATQTSSGRDEFRRIMLTPLKTKEEIEAVQQVLKHIAEKENGWTNLISNGTIMVVERFYHATLDEIPAYPSAVSAAMYKLFSGQDYSLVKYSAKHCFDFIKGMGQLNHLLFVKDAETPLQKLLSSCQSILQHMDE